MKNEVFFLERKKKVLRIKSDDNGCLIFDADGNMSEGNKMAFKILKHMAKGKNHNQISEDISVEYNIPSTMVLKDINDLDSMMKELGW